MLEQLSNLSPLARRRIRLLASLAVAIGLLFAAWQLLLILLPLVISGLTAYSLMPLVRAAGRTAPARRWPGPSSVIIAILVAALAVIIVLALFAITLWALVDGVYTLAETMPILLEGASEEWVRLESIYREQVPLTIQESVDPQVSQLYDSILEAATSSLGKVLSVVQSNIAQFITLVAAPVTIFQMLRAPSALSNSSRRLIPGPLQEDLPEMVRIAGEVIVAYFRIQLLLGAIVGVVIFIAYSVLGIPLAMALGLLGVVSELLPVIGDHHIRHSGKHPAGADRHNKVADCVGGLPHCPGGAEYSGAAQAPGENLGIASHGAGAGHGRIHVVLRIAGSAGGGSSYRSRISRSAIRGQGMGVERTPGGRLVRGWRRVVPGCTCFYDFSLNLRRAGS